MTLKEQYLDYKVTNQETFEYPCLSPKSVFKINLQVF